MPSGPRRRTANPPIRTSTPREVGDDRAVGDEDQRRALAVRRDARARLADQATPELGVVQRALQDHPRLRPTEGQARRVHAAAAWARQHLADRDPVLLEGLADPRRLRAAALVEVALGGAVVETRRWAGRSCRGRSCGGARPRCRERGPPPTPRRRQPARAPAATRRSRASAQRARPRPTRSLAQRGAALRRAASCAGSSRQSASRGSTASPAESV